MHRIAMRIVVEVDEDGQSVDSVLLNLAGLGRESLVCVTPPRGDPMKPHIEPVSSDAPRMVRSRIVVATAPDSCRLSTLGDRLSRCSKRCREAMASLVFLGVDLHLQWPCGPEYFRLGTV